MGTYPRNNPVAAARIVALALICDGHLCCSEINTLRALNVAPTLGLAEESFADIVQTLCEDQLLPVSAARVTAGMVSSATIDAMLSEVDDPKLQRTVMHLALAATLFDRHLADSEIELMSQLLRRWEPTRTLASEMT